MDLAQLIRSIPNCPKPGVTFRDITTLLENPAGLKYTVDQMALPFTDVRITQVAGIEARGFILGGAIAHQLSVGFVSIRKKGKLPWEKISIEYDLEYGTDEVEMHRDSVGPSDSVLLVDDLIATGGTACAAIQLIKETGAAIAGATFIVDLEGLGGKQKIEALGINLHSLISFQEE
ncbi:MAG: adenine phosphoribosyltransferase [Acidiferrobacteraceae bacterium]|nr:adenine phosphoribosyltransferase [Acidiferrobacteraceae bacterium]|tara:strand:+ start:402 stop:929 length:528 start_codon:yes stop_codon:yes gene_type:complete